MPRRDSAEPAGAFHDWADPDPHPFNLSRRRLCNPLGRSLGCAAHCFAISVARARAALTATFPPLDPLPSLTCDRRLAKSSARQIENRSGRSPDWLKFKNPDAPAVKREAEEDWGR